MSDAGKKKLRQQGIFGQIPIERETKKSRTASEAAPDVTPAKQDAQPAPAAQSGEAATPRASAAQAEVTSPFRPTVAVGDDAQAGCAQAGAAVAAGSAAAVGTAAASGAETDGAPAQSTLSAEEIARECRKVKLLKWLTEDHQDFRDQMSFIEVLPPQCKAVTTPEGHMLPEHMLPEQDRNFGASQLTRLIEWAIAQLLALYVTATTAFQGAAFAQWLQLISFDESKPLPNGLWLEDHRGYIVIRCKEHSWSSVAQPEEGVDVVERMKTTAFNALAEHLKSVVRTEALSLVQHLRDRFPQCKLLDASAIVTPQFLAGKDDASVAIEAMQALPVIEEQLGVPKRLGSVSLQEDVMLPPAIDMTKLRAQCKAFVSAVSGIADTVMALSSCDAPRMAVLWRRVSAAQGPQGMAQISEWEKLAQWSIVMLVGSVEDERRFSVLSFVKNKWRHALKEDHTEACLRVKCNDFFEELEEVPYERILAAWVAAKKRRKL